tara:strand:+ start:1448 stop:2362 length:915 start_codon:yes stop_codon:yes gene_type:complete
MANITSRTIKEKMGTNGYTPQKLGFDKRRPFNLGLDDQKAENSPFKATEGKYWYKINGKNVTKAEYNAYKNEPGKMEGGGKTTNDPDASGNKAKIQAAREKLPKKHTVLTEAQTKVKNQGTKIKKKPPFKKKTPLKNKYLNRIQTGLTVAGMTPGLGIIADGLNTATSLGRSAYSYAKGDKEGAKKHLAEGGVNALAMVPGLGQGVAGMKLGKEVIKKGGKELVKETSKNALKKGVVGGTKKVATDTVATTKKKKIKTDGKVYAENRPPKRTKPGAGVLKPKANKNKKPGFKTGLESITSKKVA